MKRIVPTAERADRPGADVHVLGFAGDDAALHRALVRGHPGAPAELFDRYGNHVYGVLANVLGVDDEIADLLHEVFARALANVEQLQDGARLKAWLSRIAVFTARGCIRTRVRRRWLRFFDPGDMPELSLPPAPHEAREALKATYAVLEGMKTEERIAFSLRFIQGMTLPEAAEACGTSLATLKRRLARAEQRFVRLAKRDPALAHRVERGSRWSNR